MALVLLRLRLAIARRSRGSGDGARAYFITSWVLGGVGGLLAGLTMAVLLSGRGSVDLLVLLGFCAIFIPWVVGPIVEPTLADGVVDPQRLEQFPLTTWQQVTGLLAGALVSPTATFTFLFAAGGAFGAGLEPGARAAGLGGALAFTVLCVAVSRAAQALLADALRSRRGSDVAAVAASLLVLGLYLLAQRAQAATAAIGGQVVTGPVGTVLGWTPPGAAALALLHARDGDWAGWALRTGIVLLAGWLALAAWAWALGRRVAGGTTGRARSSNRPADPSPLRPLVLRPAAPGPGVAAAAQQLRYFFFRSPRALQTLIIPPVMGVVVAHGSFAGYGAPAQAAAFAAMSVVAGSFNLFGYDGPGFGYLLLGGAPLRRVLVGKALAPLLYLLPLVVAFNVVEALLRGSGRDLATGILAGFGVVALGVGVGSLSSVLNPSDQSRVGQRHGSFLRVFGWFMGFFGFVGVHALLWWVLARFVDRWLVAVLLLVLATGTATAMLAWAARRLAADPFELLGKLDSRAA